MQKRPSTQIPPQIAARALELRRTGMTVRDIADEVGVGKSAIHELVRENDCNPPAAVAAEDRETDAEYRVLERNALAVANGLMVQVGKKIRDNGLTTVEDAKILDLATRALTAIGKQRQLRAGKPTSRVEKVQSGKVQLEHSAAPPPNPLMERVRASRQARGLEG